MSIFSSVHCCDDMNLDIATTDMICNGILRLCCITCYKEIYIDMSHKKLRDIENTFKYNIKDVKE